jgi:hypothetical protein
MTHMTKIGIVALSGKPVHNGHFSLIQIAAKENDKVMLYVSLSDRKRPNEFPISGQTMKTIWEQHIKQLLPQNVDVTYTPPSSPIRKVYEFLGAENEAGSDDVYTIYSDPVDLSENFPERSLEKYLGNLYSRRKVRLEPISRAETVNVSGTQMRRWLSVGDKDSFIQNLPVGIDGNSVWSLLKLSDS